MKHAIMPRHLMVRRTNDYDKRFTKTSDIHKIPFNDCHDDMSFNDTGNDSFGISASPQLHPSRWRVDLNTEMAWDGFKLANSEIYDDTTRTADDYSQNQPDSNFENPIVSNLLISQTNIVQPSKIASERDNRLTFPRFDEIILSSRLGEHFVKKSFKSVNQSLTECDSSPYRLMGVKKNILQRSGSVGYSRLHKKSPSKRRHTHPALKSVDENSLQTTYSNRDNPHRYLQIKSTTVYEDHTMNTPPSVNTSSVSTSTSVNTSSVSTSTSVNTSHRLGISFLRDGSFSPKKVLSQWKQSFLNTNRAGTSTESYNYITESQKSYRPDNEKIDLIDCSNFASNGVRRILHKEPLVVSHAISESKSALTFGESNTMTHLDIPHEMTQPDIPHEMTQVLDLRKTANVGIAGFVDNKENNPKSTNSKAISTISNKTLCYGANSEEEFPSVFALQEGQQGNQIFEGNSHQQTLSYADEDRDDSTKNENVQATGMARSQSSSSSLDPSILHIVLLPSHLSYLTISSPSNLSQSDAVSDLSKEMIRGDIPSIEQEINNPHELPSTVEIDVVGDLSLTDTLCDAVGDLPPAATFCDVVGDVPSKVTSYDAVGDVPSKVTSYDAVGDVPSKVTSYDAVGDVPSKVTSYEAVGDVPSKVTSYDAVGDVPSKVTSYDAVGDVPSKVTSYSSDDSGVVSDLSGSINNTQHNQAVKDDCVAHDLSNHAARPAISFASPATSSHKHSSGPLATPDRHYMYKPMYSSTPVSHAWSPFPQPNPLRLMPYQSGMYPSMGSAASQAAYDILQQRQLLSHISGIDSRRSLQNGFDTIDRLRYSSLQASTSLGGLGKPQYSTPVFSSPLPLDLPLNLTNRRLGHITSTDLGATYPSFGGSARNLFSVDQPQPRNATTSILPSQHSFSVPNLRFPPPPSVALPTYLSLPQEFPLNMSVSGKRHATSPTDFVNAGPSGCKKRRVSKKPKHQAVHRELIEIPVVQSREGVKIVPQFHTSIQSATEFPIKGVSLGSTPSGSKPISSLVKSKENMDGAKRKIARAAKKNKENVCDGDIETKQRNKPELFGVNDIAEFPVEFSECPERERFCDGNLAFQVPKIPDNAQSQSELKLALMQLFSNSNLPPVPNALQDSVHALSQYPFMQHVFSLHFQGVDLDRLKFGAFGLAFENIHLLDLGDQKFNEVLDSMSYLGDDGLLHCLVKNEKTGALCGHVAQEIGKIRRHSKNHYPDKKWVCVFCRVQMCDMTDLERHTATHTELKPFECPQCSKKFCQKVTLTQHMHKGHGQKLTKWDAKSSYICRQDGCSFSDGEEIACFLHLKQHHSQSDYIKRKNQNKWPFSCLTEDTIALHQL